MLISSAEEKIGECVVCCHRCGGFLMESASTTSYMVCPECGARLVVCVKKGKVSVFDDDAREIAGLVVGMALKDLQMSDVWHSRVCEESRIYYG